MAKEEVQNFPKYGSDCSDDVFLFRNGVIFRFEDAVGTEKTNHMFSTFSIICLRRNVCLVHCEVLVPSAVCQVLATGYGCGGRLGVGGTDCVSTPTLLESLQHVFIKKVRQQDLLSEPCLLKFTIIFSCSCKSSLKSL